MKSLNVGHFVYVQIPYTARQTDRQTNREQRKQQKLTSLLTSHSNPRQLADLRHTLRLRYFAAHRILINSFDKAAIFHLTASTSHRPIAPFPRSPVASLAHQIQVECSANELIWANAMLNAALVGIFNTYLVKHHFSHINNVENLSTIFNFPQKDSTIHVIKTITVVFLLTKQKKSGLVLPLFLLSDVNSKKYNFLVDMEFFY